MKVKVFCFVFFTYDTGMKAKFRGPIVVIYNPNSTNNAAAKAKRFYRVAQKSGYTVRLLATTHAGHAREIARELTVRYKRPLIIASSGDGGYNEVINGVMDGKTDSPSHRPVVAVIAAGNANDHKRMTRGSTPLITLLKRNDPKPLELLHLSCGDVKRYAHSYIGLGITPEVGIELNRHDLNRWREIAIVLGAFWRFQPFRIVRQGKKLKLSSLIFANIAGMAKAIKLDIRGNSLSDGKFEVITFRYRGKLILLLDMLRSVIRGNAKAPQVSSYSFTTTAKTPVQLDGEIEMLPSNRKATVRCVQGQVESLY